MPGRAPHRTNRTYKTNRSHSSYPEGFTPLHGGYEDLLSFQKARIVFDGTVCFCDRFVDKRSRTRDQMVQAARSGKQNILEGSQASGTSKETELKLTNVARASLEELLEDYRDYLRIGDYALWDKNSKEALYVRKLGRKSNRSYESYRGLFRNTTARDRRQHPHLPHSPNELPARSATRETRARFSGRGRPSRTNDPGPPPSP
jgi:four helix bundle protein